MKNIVISLLAMFLSGYSIAGLSCDCGPMKSATEALAAADAVFEGYVTKIEARAVPPSKTITVAVRKTWKGVESSQATVTTLASHYSCQYPFRVGHRYLVYAYGPSVEKLITKVGDRTRRFDSATEDLAALGTGANPKD